jgi:hypothetical protein
MCDYCVDPLHYETEEEFNANVPCNQKNKTVFINAEFFESLVPVLAQNEKMNAVIHGSGRPFTIPMFEAIKPLVNHVYAINCEFDHAMVTKIPIGFADTATRLKRDALDESLFVKSEKTNLCYLNLGIYNEEAKFFNCRLLRVHCINAFKNKSWVSGDNKKLPLREFLKRMSTCKFCICPTGFGLDTHRFYEAAKVGCRPIVVTSPLDVIYKQFGALIVNDWSEVTQELLESQPEYTIDPKVFECDYWVNSPKNSSSDE